MEYYQNFSDYYDAKRGYTEVEELVEVKPKEDEEDEGKNENHTP